MQPHPRLAVVTTLAGAFLVPSAAFAQATTTTTTGPSVAQGPQTAPDRFLNYGLPNKTFLGTQTRSNGLNPTGVNYSDCISDMTLGFPVILSGFGTGNTDGMQIWASISGTCTTDSNRGNGAVPTCWLVNNGLALGAVFTGSTEYFVRVQDIVGPQQAPPDPPILVHEGASACNAQASYAAVTITLWFVPLSGPATADTSATALQWTLSTDLVGPPAPTGLTVGAGETLLVANWTANTDSDTLGYDVFIDPPQGSLAQQMATTQVVCPPPTTTVESSSGATSSSGQDASEDGAGAPGADASDATTAADASDAAVASSSSSSSSTASSSTSSAADAGCYTVNVAQTPPSVGMCSSTVLGGAVIVDSGITPIEDDATAGEDAAVLAAEETDAGITGVGGIATIPCRNAINVGCPSASPVYTETTNITVTGETVTTFNITNVIDGVTYAVAVSAVDNSGNPGPPSTPPQCNYPAPVNDFFDLYRDAGGLAGGGFCALQGGTKLEASSDSPIGTWIALGTAGVAGVAVGRRRRRLK